jgi:hypothetical protein
MDDNSNLPDPGQFRPDCPRCGSAQLKPVIERKN